MTLRKTSALLLLSCLCLLSVANGQDYVSLSDAVTVSSYVQADRYTYFVYDLSDANLGVLMKENRSILFYVEPCVGNVSMYIRKAKAPFPTKDLFFHYSAINGGGSLQLQVELQSRKYYISIYGHMDSNFTIFSTVYTDDFPFFSTSNMTATQVFPELIHFHWNRAFAVNPNTSAQIYYKVYFQKLDGRALDLYNSMGANPNNKILIHPSLIMNTYCGMKMNTAYLPVSFNCSTLTCWSLIYMLELGSKYMLNIVAYNQLGWYNAYGGIVAEPNWFIVVQTTTDDTIKIVAISCGSVFVGIAGALFLIKKRYGRTGK